MFDKRCLTVNAVERKLLLLLNNEVIFSGTKTRPVIVHITRHHQSFSKHNFPALDWKFNPLVHYALFKIIMLDQNFGYII